MSESPDRILQAWLTGFAAAVASGSEPDLTDLLDESATWRDYLAFRWDFHHAVDREPTVLALLADAKEWEAADFAPNPAQGAFESNDAINGFFVFSTRDRVCSGFVVLVPGGERWVAKTIQTQIEGLAEHPERTRHHRTEGKVYGVVMDRTRWADDRADEVAHADREPAVVILGAGHNGLAIAARLRTLGVDALVIEKDARVGDQWRKRYSALALHSTVYGDGLPYLPMPPNWPAHTPKDKFADYLESYATLMDLNVWTSTTFRNAHFDADAQRWAVQVLRGDGSIRTLRPRHFVVAGGLYGAPRIPDIKGLSTYTGVAVHSDDFQDGSDYAGRKALVVGAGVSGHELVHDLFEHRAEVTMLQRSSTYVITYDTYHACYSGLFHEDMAYSADIGDQMAYAQPPERVDEINVRLTAMAAERDRPLLDALEAKGFKLNYGPNDQGLLGIINKGVDSYQIDIGASQLIADGRVALKQGVEIAEITGRDVHFTDGSVMEGVDLIVFATGYRQFWGHIKPALGAVGESFDKVYGRAEDGEYANTWRRSAQPGLWFGTGFIRMARPYTRYMALLIKAIEEGIEPYDPTGRGA